MEEWWSIISVSFYYDAPIWLAGMLDIIPTHSTNCLWLFIFACYALVTLLKYMIFVFGIEIRAYKWTLSLNNINELEERCESSSQ